MKNQFSLRNDVENGSNIDFVLTDTWGDGIFNGGYEIYSCQESLTGFVAFTANEPAGTMVETSYSFMAVCGDILGCMDESALNYDADATGHSVQVQQQ